LLITNPPTRKLVALAVALLIPLGSMAADANPAILHSKGGVWINGSEAVDSAAVFPGDIVEIKPGFVASLDAEGSSILIQPESILKFQGTFVLLEHGNLAVRTSAALGVHVNCIEMTPVSGEPTLYNVKDTTGTVELAAVKNDVKIELVGKLRKTSQSGGPLRSAVVHGGEQVHREENNCETGRQAPGAGNAFPTKWVAVGAGAAGAIGICLVFCKGNPQKELSQSDP